MEVTEDSAVKDFLEILEVGLRHVRHHLTSMAAPGSYSG